MRLILQQSNKYALSKVDFTSYSSVIGYLRKTYDLNMSFMTINFTAYISLVQHKDVLNNIDNILSIRKNIRKEFITYLTDKYDYYFTVSCFQLHNKYLTYIDQQFEDLTINFSFLNQGMTK